MAGSPGVLVIGGDGLVGSALARHCRERGVPVRATTRRGGGGPDALFLDLSSPEGFLCPAGVTAAVICAAVAPYGACESDPSAVSVNAVAPGRLLRALSERGVFTVFVSSNTVFGGERPFPDEDDPLAPGFEYARQKAMGERSLGTGGGFAVCRLTKVLTAATAPLPGWRRALESGGIIAPFSDLVFAPVSLGYAAAGLARVALAGVGGRFHLSGEENLSYEEFARRWCAALGYPASRVKPTTSAEAGVAIPFKPRYSALGMRRTERVLGLRPQSVSEVISGL